MLIANDLTVKNKPAAYSFSQCGVSVTEESMNNDSGISYTLEDNGFEGESDTNRDTNVSDSPTRKFCSSFLSFLSFISSPFHFISFPFLPSWLSHDSLAVQVAPNSCRTRAGIAPASASQTKKLTTPPPSPSLLAAEEGFFLGCTSSEVFA